MLTAAAVQGFKLFAGYLSAAADRTGSPLEALYANGRLYLEFSDPYPGHFEIMFRPALITAATQESLLPPSSFYE
jgi:hypothetical protein